MISPNAFSAALIAPAGRTARRLVLLHSRLAFLACLALVAVPASHGQAPAASLRGRVLDPTRAAIAGARITAARAAGPAVTTSDESGEFQLALPPGTYTLTVSAGGFVEAARAIELPLSGLAVQEFVLRPAGPSQTVVVVEPPDYRAPVVSSATRTPTALLDVPQSVSVVTGQQVRDQMLLSVGEVVRYMPGITAHQGENNRDQVVIRGNNSSADFFLDGVRDDVQYFRDLYNVERVEALKGPNAMLFGRGGGGGVINRVSKEAAFFPMREITLLGGSQGSKRAAVDLEQPLHRRLAFRLNGMYENSDSFRRFLNLERYGINPTATIQAGDKTRVTLGYEHLHDTRVADRGIPSYSGLPVDVPIETYFGNPADSHVRAQVNLGSVAVEHQATHFVLRNRTLFGDYDRGYQNFVPGAVSADRTQVSISAYNNASRRRNAFNQTDLTSIVGTGPIRHTLLGGAEVGRQLTDNFRNTGFFNNSATSLLAPLANPVITTPVTFRQSATDPDNHLAATVAAGYVQDQVELTRHLQVIAGLRFDRFDLRLRNHRTGESLERGDNLVSPRVGLVLKPLPAVSLYGNYSVSYLPSSGDQFSQLTSITQQLKPEKFNNYEFGVKWDLRRDLALTTAVYRLDRANTRSIDPNDPARLVQTGRTRSDGFEVGMSGRVVRRWQLTGGYAYQDAFIARATSSARAGAQVAQVPHHAFSLWNHYQVLPRVGAGLGIVSRADMFAAFDNTVRLPGYTRADAAVYVALTERVRLQVNAENLLSTRYYANADGNNNISPGSPRALRAGLTARF